MMASYFYSSALMCVCFLFCAFNVLTRDYKKFKPRQSQVLLTNDGPTTVGGKTTLTALVINCRGAYYRYCLQGSKGQDCYIGDKPQKKLLTDKWRTSGKKSMTLFVEVTTPFIWCGKNTTSIVVTDTINAQLNICPHPQGDHYFVGPINMSVEVHDPSHLFDPKEITYLWNFNESTKPEINHCNRITHNFTEDRVYFVSVFIRAQALGKLYNGTASKILHFAVDFSPSLQVYNMRDHLPSPMLRLAPPSKDTIFIALGEVEFILTYNDPYSIIKSVTTGWSFQDGPTYPHVPGNKKTYSYTRVEEMTYVWATPIFVTPNAKYSLEPLLQALTVEEPVSNLNLTINSLYTTKDELQANVTCLGSKPFQMCWKLFKTLDEPLFDNCTSLSQTCAFVINYTIPSPGSFALDVFILNHVSSLNHAEHFKIPEPPSPKPHHGNTARAVVPIILCIIILIIVLIFVARKVYRSRHHSVLETADFDFRDEDSRSIDSYVIDYQCCYSFRICRRKKKEKIPLLEDWGRTDTTSTYSDLL